MLLLPCPSKTMEEWIHPANPSGISNPMKKYTSQWLLIFLFASLAGCGSKPENQSAVPSNQKEKTQVRSRFVDITDSAGIRFVHNNGAFGKKYLPESMGSGSAFLDYDSDGDLDILLVNSTNWPGHGTAPSFPALYRNNGDGTFTDVTSDAGLAREMYGLGAAIADYDNDGDPDIYITCLGADRFFRNNGDGTFIDFGEPAGVRNNDFAISAAWLDYDRDGFLDLFVCNYVQWTVETDLFCSLDGVNKSYCTPESYPGVPSRLFRNRGDGTFEDSTEKAGVFDPTGKALGVVVLDYNNDGNPDLFVANDTQPNKLYSNNGDGTFTERGTEAGVAFSEMGIARAGMGVDAADYGDNGYPGLLIGNFSNEMIALYHNEGTGLFIDDAPSSTVGQSSLLTLTFSTFFFDYDLDGELDIFAANGHVHDDIQKVQQQVQYAQPPHLFHNAGNRRFVEVTSQAGDLARPIVARGAAYGDIDNDGDPDLLVNTNGGKAFLFRNELTPAPNYVRIHLQGTKSNRDGIGSRVLLHLKDGSTKSRTVKAGTGYCSQSELPITFGLQPSDIIESLTIEWASGGVQKVPNLSLNKIINIVEQ